MHKNSIIFLFSLLLVFVSAIAYWNYNQKKSRLFEASFPDPSQYLSLQTRSIPASELNSTLHDQLNLLYLDENYQTALQRIQEALSADPGNTSLHYHAGLLNLKLLNNPEATHHFQFIRMNSSIYHKSALRYLIMIQIQEDQNLQAALFLQEFINVSSPEESAWAQTLLSEIQDK